MVAGEYADSRAAALRIVAAAHQITRNVQRQSVETGKPAVGGGVGADQVTSAAKADASPVTVADYAAQAFITMRLAALFPDDSFIAEESSAALRESPALLSLVTAAVQIGLQAMGDAQAVGESDVLTAIDRAGSAGGDGRRTWM